MTAAVATDPALVVTVSPNNTIFSTTGDVVSTGALGALNAAVQVITAGLDTVGFQLAAGTLIGTIIPEVSFDGGTTWNSTYFDSPNGGKVATIVFSSANTATSATIVGVGGSGISRVRVSAYTSGTANITVRATTRTDPSVLFANPAGSTGAPPSMAYVGSSVTTSAPTYTTGTINSLSLNTTGDLRVAGKVTDGTNVAAVKAASTAAVATNPALVVAISPNNSLGIVVNDTTTSGTLGALNATVQLAVTGENNAGMQLSAGTLIGTIVPEISMDGGTTWVQGMLDDPTTSNVTSSVVFASANTATTKTIVGVGGSSHVRIRVSAYTSGSATCALRASEMNDPTVLYGGSAGSALPPVIAQNGGSITTSAPTYTTGTLNALSLNTTGDLRVIGKVTDGTNVAAVKAASTAALATDPALVVTLSPNSNQSTNNSYPNPVEYITSTESETIDLYGNLQTRGPVFTDEGLFRDDFSGSGLTTTLTGTLTFTNGSTIVTGSGTSFLTAIKQLQYIKQSSDSETLYIQVFSVQSNTQLTLLSPYAGTTTSGATAVISNWQTTTGSGASITVASSVVTIASGTTVAASTQIKSLGDYGPYSGLFYCQISQRIANQTAYIGFQDTSGTRLAMMQFTGTNNTQALFVTSYSGAEIQATTVTIPNGGTTATYHQYKIDISATQVTCSIDGIIVGVNTLHIPGPYDLLYSVLGINNSSPAPASSTTIQTDYFFYEDVDRVQVESSFPGEPLPAKLTDGSNAVAVKAASTAPVATDPALVVTLSPNSSGHIKGTLEPLYGTNNQSVTITLISLINYVANTASNAAASAAIDNTTTLYEDVLLFFKFTTNTGTAATGYVNVYGYGTVDGGTTYPEGITGSAASIQVTSPPNLVLIAQVNATTASKTFTHGPVSFCRMYGLDRLPAKWGVVVTNNTGAAFTATAGNYAITYQGINGQLV